MTEFDIWVYRPDAGYQQGADIVGYKVEAKDGTIGKIQQALRGGRRLLPSDCA
ncbi:hypothetical protein AB0C70_42490 [Streptomyces sp. NPDC048564]|uniref:hypothetical protein n=1 Tax=Streptomyces sp. NPDC048564 TaxID=3155760 RepID=UPI00343C9DFB